MFTGNVCVFCGASEGGRPGYLSAATQLAEILVDDGVGIVYGAGGVGIMGALAQRALDRGGRVIGIVPSHLVQREMARSDLDDLRVVGSMHERKQLMHDLSDGFVVLPGGLGTLEEFFEVLTWAQLGIHDKPIVAVDVEGYFAPLGAFLDHAVAEGFVSASDRALVHIVDSPAAAAQTLRDHRDAAFG